jgi:hypothetical protein
MAVEVLYVVTSGPPGPGARALVDEALRALPSGHVDESVVTAATEAAGEGCEFVELEDADGKGVGPSSGVHWSDHPNGGGMKRLGPFLGGAEALRTLALRRRVDWWNADVRYKAPEMLAGAAGLAYFRSAFVDLMRAAGYDDVADGLEQ